MSRFLNTISFLKKWKQALFNKKICLRLNPTLARPWDPVRPHYAEPHLVQLPPKRDPLSAGVAAVQAERLEVHHTISPKYTTFFE